MLYISSCTESNCYLRVWKFFSLCFKSFFDNPNLANIELSYFLFFVSFTTLLLTFAFFKLCLYSFRVNPIKEAQSCSSFMNCCLFNITLPFYPMLGLLCVYRTSVQAMGNSIAPFVACIVELVARSASSIILASVIGYAGVVFSSPLAWIGADLIVIPSYIYMMRRLKRGKR